MLPAPELAAVLAAIAPTPATTTFVRRVSVAALFGLTGPVPPPGQPFIAYSPDFFFISGSPYRFNPPGLETLYLGEGESTAGAEAKQHPGARGFDFEPRNPDVIYHVSVTVSMLLDVTDPATVAALGATGAELLSNWRLLSPNAPTQTLGRLVFDSRRFEGIRYQSAPKASVGEIAGCVALFPERKLTTSRVVVYDNDRNFVQEL